MVLIAPERRQISADRLPDLKKRRFLVIIYDKLVLITNVRAAGSQFVDCLIVAIQKSVMTQPLSLIHI